MYHETFCRNFELTTFMYMADNFRDNKFYVDKKDGKLKARDESTGHSHRYKSNDSVGTRMRQDEDRKRYTNFDKKSAAKKLVLLKKKSPGIIRTIPDKKRKIIEGGHSQWQPKRSKAVDTMDNMVDTAIMFYDSDGNDDKYKFGGSVSSVILTVAEDENNKMPLMLFRTCLEICT